VSLFSVASSEIKDENRASRREFCFGNVYDIYRLDGKTAHIMLGDRDYIPRAG